MLKHMKIGIIGYGGFAREISCRLKKPFKYFISDNSMHYYKNNDIVMPLSKFNPNEYEALIAIANPIIKTKIVNELPKNTTYYTFIDEYAHLWDKNIIVGDGSIISSGAILTTNINIGKHVIINYNATIGHDTIIGNYTSILPGANIAGNCNIGNCNLIGSNAAIKEKITTCDNVTIGLGAGVTKNITKSGIYVGIPANMK